MRVARSSLAELEAGPPVDERALVLVEELLLRIHPAADADIPGVAGSGLLDGAALVYSADAALNERVASDARALGIPVNAVDNPDISTFIVPSIVDRDPVVVAIGTEVTAPILVQGLRARIERPGLVVIPAD